MSEANLSSDVQMSGNNCSKMSLIDQLHNISSDDTGTDVSVTENQVAKCSPIKQEKHSENFNHADFFRLRSFLVEFMEELKIRRSNDEENEEWINQLVQEKYELERKCDSEREKVQSLEDQHQRQLLETKRGFEEKILLIEAENKQLSVYRECGDKEIKLLKDEVRNLQLSKYSMEKKIREQERHFQLQRSSAEQQLAELSTLEKKMTTMNDHFLQVTEAHNRLEKNVIEAVRLNKTLMYINEHQKCIIDHHRADKTDLQTQLVEMKVRLEAKPAEVKDVQKYIVENTALQQHVKHLTRCRDELVVELEECKVKNEKAIEDLKMAHSLVERHLDSSEKFQKETELLEQEQQTLDQRVVDLQRGLVAACKELEVSQQTHTAAAEDWKQQSSDLLGEIDKLKTSLEEVAKSKADLEDLNSQWAQKNMDVTKLLEEAKAKLEVPKLEVDQQTVISLFHVSPASTQTLVSFCSRQTQTELNLRISTTQTERPSISWATTQTIDAALANTASQTESLSKSNQYVQTENDNLADTSSNNGIINKDLSYVSSEVHTNYLAANVAEPAVVAAAATAAAATDGGDIAATANTEVTAVDGNPVCQDDLSCRPSVVTESVSCDVSHSFLKVNESVKKYSQTEKDNSADFNSNNNVIINSGLGCGGNSVGNYFYTDVRTADVPAVAIETAACGFDVDDKQICQHDSSSKSSILTESFGDQLSSSFIQTDDPRKKNEMFGTMVDIVEAHRQCDSNKLSAASTTIPQDRRGRPNYMTVASQERQDETKTRITRDPVMAEEEFSKTLQILQHDVNGGKDVVSVVSTIETNSDCQSGQPLDANTHKHQRMTHSDHADRGPISQQQCQSSLSVAFGDIDAHKQHLTKNDHPDKMSGSQQARHTSSKTAVESILPVSNSGCLLNDTRRQKQTQQSLNETSCDSMFTPRTVSDVSTNVTALARGANCPKGMRTFFSFSPSPKRFKSSLDIVPSPKRLKSSISHSPKRLKGNLSRVGIACPFQSQQIPTGKDAGNNILVVPESSKPTSKNLVDSGMSESARKDLVDSGRSESARKDLVDSGSPESARKDLVDSGRSESARKDLVDSGRLESTRKDLVDSGRSEFAKKDLVDSGRSEFAKKDLVDSGRPDSAKKDWVDSARSEYARKDSVDSGRSESARKDLVDSWKPESARKDWVDSARSEYARKDSVDSGRSESARKDLVDSGRPESARKDLVDSGRPESATKDLVDSGRSKSTRKDLVDSGRPESARKDLVDSARKDLVGSGVPESARKDLIDCGSTNCLNISSNSAKSTPTDVSVSSLFCVPVNRNIVKPVSTRIVTSKVNLGKEKTGREVKSGRGSFLLAVSGHVQQQLRDVQQSRPTPSSRSPRRTARQFPSLLMTSSIAASTTTTTTTTLAVPRFVESTADYEKNQRNVQFTPKGILKDPDFKPQLQTKSVSFSERYQSGKNSSNAGNSVVRPCLQPCVEGEKLLFSDSEEENSDNPSPQIHSLLRTERNRKTKKRKHEKNL